MEAAAAFLGLLTGAIPSAVLSYYAASLYSRFLPIRSLRVVTGKFTPLSVSQKAAIEKTAATQASLALAITQAEGRKALYPPQAKPEEENPLNSETRDQLRAVAAEVEEAVDEAVQTGDKEYVRKVVSVQALLAENAKALSSAASLGEVTPEQRSLFEENLVLLGTKLEQVKAERRAEGGKGLRVINKYLREALSVEPEKVVT